MASRPTPYSIALCALIALHYEGDSIVLHTSGRDAAASTESTSPLYQTWDKQKKKNNNDGDKNDDNDEDDDIMIDHDEQKIHADANVNDQRLDQQQRRHSVEAFLQETLLQQGRIGFQRDADQASSSPSSSSSSGDNDSLPIWARTRDRPIREFVLEFRSRVAGTSSTTVDQNDVPGVVTTYLQWLGVASSSLDALMDLMTTLQLSVTKTNPVIDATSVSGMYIQSVCCLGFAQLSFAETGRLWKHFQAEVQEATRAIFSSSRTPSSTLQNDTKRQETAGFHEWSLSPDQMENLLRHECQLRKDPTTSGSFLGRQQTENGIFHVLNENPELPSAHFLRFLHCLGSKERVGAIDALHAYSDYVLIRRRHHMAANPSTNNNNNNNNNPNQARANNASGETRQANNQSMAMEHQQILQFAAILLAALHYETGDIALARLATDEAVRVAQQSQNASGCVAYSLGWLSQTASPAASLRNGDSNSAHKNHFSDLDHYDAREWMARCVDRSVEGDLRSLVAGANLSRVRQTLEQSLLFASNSSGGGSTCTSLATTAANNGGGGGAPSPMSPFAVAQSAWALLSAAATTESTETAAASTHFIPPNDRPLHMNHILHGDAALSIVARQRVIAASIWNAYNQPSLSGLSSFLALQLFSSAAKHGRDEQLDKSALNRPGKTNNGLLSPNHVAAAIQNVARKVLYGSKQSILIGSKPSIDVAMKTKKSGQHDGDERKVGHGTCIYGDALLLMSRLRRSFGVEQDDSGFLQEMALIVHEWAVRRGDLLDAQSWMRFLLSNIHPGMANHAHIQIDVRIQQSLLLAAQKEWDRAKQVLKVQLQASKMAGLPVQSAWVLLQLAHLLISASAYEKQHQQDQGSVTNALPYLLQCLAVCDEHGMDGLHAVAMSVLAQVHVRMLRYDAAIAIIEAALPNILQQGHVWYQAEAYLTLARAQLMRAKRADGRKDATGAPTETNRKASTYKTIRQQQIVDAALLMAIRALSKSQELFERCQDGNKLKEVFYLQANAWNWIPNSTVKREEASQRFVALSKYLGEASFAHPLSEVFENVLLNFDGGLELEKLANRPYV
ncbi:hypothetical protein ACA910_015953 [Epithemia clementina (nom. ined.)]